METNCDTSVKVAVRIRPLSTGEIADDSSQCITTVPGEPQIRAGTALYTYDYVFDVDSTQADINEKCVTNLVEAAFDGFNATILAYGQTGSGKTYTMGSAGDNNAVATETQGIIPRVISNLFDIVQFKETENSNSSYKISVQFLEIYGEDIRDLLDITKSSKVSVRENPAGEVYVSGAWEQSVTSPLQMLKLLADGSKHRITSATLMNQSSSRSHAIFTILIEHTLHPEIPQSESITLEGASVESPDTAEVSETGVVVSETADVVPLNGAGVVDVEGKVDAVAANAEVRKCKFHFVDLAGSERIKRSGVEGQQLKEGIDINKGLLALGNVISALGDEQKRGKVHVPYRDSKLTRMLQDSLGGNSKTLFICCVSPAESNFHESANALRYANRARNIQNKPVVNRDPTALLISQLRAQIQYLANEVSSLRGEGAIPLNSTVISPARLENPGSMVALHPGNGDRSGGNAARGSGQLFPPSGGASAQYDAAVRDVMTLKSRVSDSDAEIQRLVEQLKIQKQLVSDGKDQLILAQSERDFYKMKLIELIPKEMEELEAGQMYAENDKPVVGEEVPTNPLFVEKTKSMNVLADYLRTIDDLKQQLSDQRRLSVVGNSHNGGDLAQHYDSETSFLEGELTSSVARVIAQAQTQLNHEQKLLLSGINAADAEANDELSAHKRKKSSIARESLLLDDEDTVEDGDYETENDIEAADKEFQKRQNLMNSEVVELSESILLKEQLVQQLQKSQHQYTVMKAFYEQKLISLNEEVTVKESERAALLAEIQNMELKSDAIEHTKSEKEQKLRRDLQKKDDELKMLRKKQDELGHLSQVQQRFMSQIHRYQDDIDTQKKQRVDLTKKLRAEKKKHLMELNGKAREIEKLKRDLMKSARDLKQMGVAKERAENKIKEGLLLKKQSKYNAFDSSDLSSKNTRKALLASSSNTRAANAPRRVLSDEDLKVKKWLDVKISNIGARDEEAEALHRQCEQQLTLQHIKKNLMTEKTSLMTALEELKLANLDDGTENEKELLKKQESLNEVEARIENLDDQLRYRRQKINDMQTRLAKMDETTAHDKTVDNLKRMAAASLPAAHELIRLLFDLLVNSRAYAKAKKDACNHLVANEKKLQQQLDDANSKLNAVHRSLDMELTKAVNDYEEKLSGLLTYSSVGKMILEESKLANGSEDEALIRKGNNMVQQILSPSPMSPPATPSSSASKPNLFSNSVVSGSGGHYGDVPKESYDQAKMLLVVATEQNRFLKEQLQKDEVKARQLNNQVVDLETEAQSLRTDIEDKNVHIKFLEEECRMFRDLSEDLKLEIKSLSGDNAGDKIITRVVDYNATSGTLSPSRKRRSINNSGADEGSGGGNENVSAANNFMNATNAEEEISAGLLGDFSNLAEEINRTGGVPVSSSVPRPGSGAWNGGASKGGDSGIYDRLTNPDYYTGAMKKVFEQDLPKKREKVQQIKNQLHNISLNFNITQQVAAGEDTNANSSVSQKRPDMDETVDPPMQSRGSSGALEPCDASMEEALGFTEVHSRNNSIGNLTTDLKLSGVNLECDDENDHWKDVFGLSDMYSAGAMHIAHKPSISTDPHIAGEPSSISNSGQSNNPISPENVFARLSASHTLSTKYKSQKDASSSGLTNSAEGIGGSSKQKSSGGQGHNTNNLAFASNPPKHKRNASIEKNYASVLVGKK